MEDGLLGTLAMDAFNARTDIMMKGLDAPRGQKGSLCTTYMANRAHILANDWALQVLTTKGYNHYKVPDNFGVLASTEHRYFVKVASLPDDLRELGAQQGHVERSCIYNSKTKETRLEVAWSEPRPSLWSLTDQGSSGWHGKLNLYYAYNVRGAERFYVPHRTVRNRALAIGASDGGFVKSEWPMLFGWCSAPHRTHGNGQLLRDVSVDIRRNFTPPK